MTKLFNVLILITILLGVSVSTDTDHTHSCDTNDKYCMEYHKKYNDFNQFQPETYATNGYYMKLLNVIDTMKEIRRTFGTSASINLIHSLLPFPDNPLGNILFVLVLGIALIAFAGWVGFYAGWVIGCEVARKFR